MSVQASIRLLALVLRRPNHILANPLVPVMFCDYDYEETNPIRYRNIVRFVIAEPVMRNSLIGWM